MLFYYREIDNADVDPLTRARARDVLEYCRKALGLAAVEIQWVRSVRKEAYEFSQAAMKVERLLGSADPISIFCQDEKEFFGQNYCSGPKSQKIFVREDIPMREILMTIAHECRHFRDSQIYRPPWRPEEKEIWERQAEEFAKEAISFLEKSARVSP